MDSMIPAFRRFRKEADLIGGILTDYGEIEYAMCMCVAMGVGDLDMVVKVLYRTRGESQRIGVADAIGRKAYHALKLGTQFEEAIGAMKVCTTIRNNYAHANWHDDLTGRLSFLNLEDIAKPNAVVENFEGLTFKYLNVSLLEAQRRYFRHAGAWFYYLNFEGRKRAGKLSTHLYEAPKKTRRPPFFA